MRADRLLIPLGIRARSNVVQITKSKIDVRH